MKGAGTVITVGAYNSTTPLDLTGATGDKGTYVCGQRMRVSEIGLRVTTAINNSANLQLDFHIDPAGGGSRVDQGVGRLTHTATVAAGQTLSKKLDVDCAKGDLIVVDLTQAATAGAGYPYFIFDPEGAGAAETYETASL